MDLLNKLKSMLGEPAEPEVKVSDSSDTTVEKPCDCSDGTCNCTNCNCDDKDSCNCKDGDCESCKTENKDE